MEPKVYDMKKREDIERWFREMNGYLKTENFLEQGTDREGRKFAMCAFHDLRHILLTDIKGGD